ncbi:hypothetical protein V9T40_012867 [Parthenolecanium corni]|uniref:alpha-1,2-Mannosidase n=1 Tax=Parthenolecanium corni TaxID=536013 RepID=A0AAN9T9Q6_9HEMI
MSKEEREMLKREAMDMFYHGYFAYMNNAYPADELMPLSCKGRYRNSEPSRGNVDEALGNFSLTLIDSMDTLVILGDFDEFEKAVKLVIRDVTFDTNVVVSVFETNIRILGGLLSGHVLSEVLKTKYQKMNWYNGELLDMAKDLGYRLLPAFNTTTGIPYGRVNLKNGIKPNFPELTRDTCTACAGTMILEMAALSRLTGEPIFEQKAHKTMDELWNLRHRTSNLMGTILNVHSGDWIRRDSGVGAGIDSYYEYCLKAYILLSDEKYLRRFNTHYSAVMTYISQGPMLLDVHMHKPNTNTKNFMDALLAFWPGLQVLKGDLKPAIETHEMLYQVMRRHKFIPEAFTTDFQIHWGQHPLRPEFLESTYFLYRATGDHYYLHVGRNVLRSLQTYARVACGYASVKDVRTGAHEDSMDSFVLAETFKYLYLLFADPADIPINLDDYLFTTEAHFLPLSISRYSPPKKDPTHDDLLDTTVGENDRARSCVLEKYVGHILRQNLRNLVEGICPERKFSRKLYASQFQSYNKEHVKLLNDMGITIAMLSDGRMQLVHNYVTAASKTDANEGVLFMQEMVELSKTHSPDNIPQSVSFSAGNKTVVLSAGPANFGKILRSNEKVSAVVSVATPLRACEPLRNPDELRGRIVIVERGECMFVEKARKLEKAGAVGGIIVDNIADSSSDTWPLFAMSGDGKDDVNIPVVFLFTQEAKTLINAVEKEPNLNVTLSQLETNETERNIKLDADNTLEKLKGSLEGIIYNPDKKQKKVSDEDSADYTVRSYRVTIPGGANSDAIIVKSKVPTAKKLGELKAAGALDGPITLNDFGANIDADQLHLRLGELIREAIATDLKINSNAKPQMEKKAAETAARRPADADVIVKARSFVASADDESADRTLVALERELAESKERLQKLISLLADSGQPANVDTTRMRLLHLSQPKAESQVRGPTVVREDTEEKNRSDQVEDESGAQTLAAGGDAFETGDQKYRDLIKQMQMVVEKADKPAEANERAIPSGGGKKDEL